MQILFPHVPLSADKFSFNVFYTWMIRHCPYAFENQDSLADMIRKVAQTMADPGQTEADLAKTAAEVETMNAQKMRTLAGVLPGPRVETITFTVAELNAFCPDRFTLHRNPSDWNGKWRRRVLWRSRAQRSKLAQQNPNKRLRSCYHPGR